MSARGLNDVVKASLRIVMNTARARLRSPTRRFGRRAPFVHADVPAIATPAIGDDLRLFLVSFAGGLLFMTVYLA